MLHGFPTEQLFLIAGPCVLEDDDLNLRVGEALARLAASIPGGVIYKASFDKANRSGATAHRGPGIEKGLEQLARVRSATGLPVLTDVHLPEQCAAAAQCVDVLQIPAFLCRQTDLLEAAGATGRPVNVKKGQWMHPEGMKGAVEKVRRAREASGQTPGASERTQQPAPAISNQQPARAASSPVTGHSSYSLVAVTERGSFFGYGDLVVDMRSLARLREATEAPVIFDGTHSVQRPGMGEGGASGGTREHIAALTLAAVAAGAAGLFLETHPTPDRAPSDGPNMLPLDQLPAVIRRAVRVWEAARA